MKLIPPVPPEFRVKGPFEFFEALRRLVFWLKIGRNIQKSSVVSAAGTTTALIEDYVIIITGTSTQTVNLPSAEDGKQYIVKNRSTGNVTVTPAGTDTIDGVAASITLTTGQFANLICNGSDWCRL